jgi:hypothetical protein
MLSIIRYLLSCINRKSAPDGKMTASSIVRPASIGLMSTRAPASCTVNPHSLSPAISSDAGVIPATEPMNEKLNYGLEKRPFTIVGPFRHVFMSLPNKSAAEVMFISLAQDYGLDEAIDKAHEMHLGYMRPLHALREAMNEQPGEIIRRPA